jgi:tetratricopeptide (TPR) repeat protein
MAEQQGQLDQWAKAQPISRPPAYGTPYRAAEVATPERPQPNYVKWGLGCTGVLMVLFTIGAMFMLIITPVVFRNLLPEQQAVWMHRLPFLEAFRPTRIYQNTYLPTAVVDDAAVQTLLAPESGGAANVASLGGSDPGAANPDPGAAAALVASPTPLAPTVTATPSRVMPTPMLATNTPVISTAIPTATLPASATPLPTATVALPTLPPTDVPIPSAASATGIKFIQQGWNNCGPANLTQVLRKYGWSGTQADAAAYLKPWSEDKNVSPWQMVSYVRDNFEAQGLRALFRYGGNLRLLKALIANDFGVIVEKGHFIVGEGWMGHYLTLVGYDDLATYDNVQGVMYGMDTNLGPGPNGGGRPFNYTELDNRWRQFNRVFIVVYPINREAELATILGNYADEEWAVRSALNTAKREASELGGDAYSWYNIGTNLTLLGQYREAAYAFDKARSLNLESRFFWYQFEQYNAYYHIGRFDDVLDLTRVTLQSASDGRGLGLEEQHYWRGMVFAARGDAAAAEQEFQVTLEWNKYFWPARDALEQVRNGAFRAPSIGQ